MAADATDNDLTPLQITRAAAIADGIHLFELRHPDGADLPEFTPGAHVSVRVPNGLIRKYSLCNDPDERDRYCIAVKRETREGSCCRYPRRATISNWRKARPATRSSPEASASRRS